MPKQENVTQSKKKPTVNIFISNKGDGSRLWKAFTRRMLRVAREKARKTRNKRYSKPALPLNFMRYSFSFTRDLCVFFCLEKASSRSSQGELKRAGREGNCGEEPAGQEGLR